MAKIVVTLLAGIVLAAQAPLAAQATAGGINGRLVFTANVGPHTQLFTIAPDGTALKQLTHFNDGSDALNANWSPDGSRVAFERDFPHPRAAVVTMTWDGRDLRVLTPPAPKDHILYDAIPAWSPDGKRLVFARNIAYSPGNNGPKDHTELWLMTPSGSVLSRVTPVMPTGPNGNHFPDHPQFSPDGKRIVYVQKLGSRSAGFVIGVDGSGLRQVTPWRLGVEDRIDWSPDGSLILFSSANDDAHGVVSNVYTVRPDATGLKQITHEKAGTRISIKACSWSPDGKLIMAVRDTGPTSSLWLMDADGSNARQLTRGLAVHGGSWGSHT